MITYNVGDYVYHNTKDYGRGYVHQNLPDARLAVTFEYADGDITICKESDLHLEDASMRQIRDWYKDHPEALKAIESGF